MIATRTRPARGMLAGALLVLFAVTGCAANGSSGGSSSGAGAGGRTAEQRADQAQSASKSANSGAQPAGSTGGVLDAAVRAADGVSRVRTAELMVEVRDLDLATARVRAVATGAGGFVGSEDDGSNRAVLVLRIPEPRLDGALGQVADTGRELSRHSTEQDVTADLADLTSRTRTAQASVARVRTLLARAATLSDVVLLEGELTKREADLESAQARQRALSSQAALATLTVELSVRAAPAVAPKGPGGFLAGLRDGWRALAASTAVLLTALGAGLPFAVALTVIGVPAYWLVRRLRDRSGLPAASAAPAGD